MDYQELKPRKDETGILYREGIYFHSPSDFARKNLYYIHFGGLYTCTFPYRVNREYYHTFLLVRVLDGKFCVRFGDDTICAGTGSVILLDCKQKHSYWVQETTAFQWFHFDGCAAQAYFDYLTGQHGVCFTGQPELFLLFDSILEELKTDHGNEHRLSILIHNILGLLAGIGKRNEPAAVTEAIQYMTAHYRDNISVADIAGYLALNPRYFSKVFKRQQIADECGFTSSTHFIRAFRQENDITPQKYRNILFSDSRQ